jgi:hypothetical protein
MRTAQTFAGGSPVEVRIVVAEDERTRSLVKRVVDSAAAQIGQRQQARGVAVVHEKPVAIAIGFEGVDLAVAAVRPGGPGGDALANFSREFAASVGEGAVRERASVYLSELLQYRNGNLRCVS